jgi:uncharacterized protein YjbI with pentapeptide repeats
MPVFEDGRHYQRQRFSGLALPAETFADIEFEGCAFERSVFAGATFSRCRFRDCRFIGCDLSLLKVPNCRFTGVQFTESKLIGVDWTAAGDSETARMLLSLSFDGCVLDYAGFFGLSLREAKLARCTAKEANFTDADLRGADCRGTDFAAAVFLHTNLENANFLGARSYAIDPTANRVRGARFSLPEAISLLSPFGIIIEY